MMNEILAFTNNASLCLNNLHRFELDDACPASRLTDSKTANAAIVWIGLAGLAIASFQLAKRLAAKKDPPMIQEFASRWKEANQFVNPLIRYVPMNGLFTEEDCQHLRTIFQSWRLHSGFCFFDLLGAQMHRNWKRAGVSKDDLRTFGEICRTLSLLVMESTENPRNYGSDIKKIRSRIETLGKRLPNTNAPELKIFLKALSDPGKTIVLGVSAVLLFEGSEALGQGTPSRNDVLDFLEFAADMHPTFSGLLISDDTRRMRVLDSLIIATNKGEHLEGDDKRTLLLEIKHLFEARIFEVKIPFFRLFENSFLLKNLDELPQQDAKWIQRQYGKFLQNKYLEVVDEMLAPAFEHGPIQSVPTSDSETMMHQIFRMLATNCYKKGSLKDLEDAILRKLQYASNGTCDEETYGKLFAQMVCLYQTVHDLGIIVDPSKNLLGESQFPQSLSSLARLSSAREKSRAAAADKNQSDASSSRSSQNPKQASTVSPDGESSSSEEEEDDPPPSRTKTKTRPQPPTPIGKIPPAPPLPVFDFDETEDGTEIERPFFPQRASPEQALQHLLENGFVIERVRGSHYQMKHVVTHTPTSVPLHGDRLKPGTLNSIRDAFYKSHGFET